MGCCCNEVGTGTFPTGCCCDSPADYYGLQFSGVTNGTKTGCTLANVQACLCYRNCGWYTGFIGIEEASGGACLTDYNRIMGQLEFDCDAPEPGTGSGTGTAAYRGIVRLTVYGLCYISPTNHSLPVELATYILDRDSWRCLEDNVMYLSTYTGECGNWPATVTIDRHAQTTVCNCNCAGRLGIRGNPVIMEVLMGPTSSTGSGTGEDCTACSCDVILARICMPYACEGLGAWRPTYSIHSDGIELADPQPGSCHIAHLYANQVANLNFDAETNTVVFGWPTDHGYGTATYSISADLFNHLGNNTLTLDPGSTYNLCVLPATIQINYYSNDPQDCSNFRDFECDICTPPAVLPGGWTFTITDAVTGGSHLLCRGFDSFEIRGKPCEAIPGTYCLGLAGYLFSGCPYWSTDLGTGWATGEAPYRWPDPMPSPYELASGQPGGSVCFGGGGGGGPITDIHQEYIKATASASMYILGGAVYVQITLLPVQGHSGPCRDTYVYEISASDFVCNGPNTLYLKCGSYLPDRFATNITDSNGNDEGACTCTGIPNTITIFPTSSCGEEPPDTGCGCISSSTPKSSYTPSVTITGIDNQGCEECSCYADFKVCLDATGSSDECTWGKSFTLGPPTEHPSDPGGIPSCDYQATSIELIIAGETAPGDVVITLYQSGTRLVEYRLPLSEFSCSSTSMQATLYFSSGNCQWGSAVCILNMHETPCKTCLPCDTESISPPDTAPKRLQLEYDGSEVILCLTRTTGACDYLSGVVATDTTGVYLFGYLQFGYRPTSYVRAFIYKTDSPFETGTGSGEAVLIGVYNYLQDSDNFPCSMTSTLMYLAAGNDGQCGDEVNQPGYTEYLSGTLSIDAETSGCIGVTCDGVEMPATLAISMPTSATTGCECTSGPTGSLVYNSGSNRWEGTITCNHAYGGSTTLNVSVYQTGTLYSDMRLDFTADDTCDTVTGAAPTSGSCGNIVWTTLFSIRYYFNVTW